MIITEVKECRKQKSSVMAPAVMTYLHNHVNEYNYKSLSVWPLDGHRSVNAVGDGRDGIRQEFCYGDYVHHSLLLNSNYVLMMIGVIEIMPKKAWK